MGKTRSFYCNLSWLTPSACSLNPLGFPEAASTWSSQWRGSGEGCFPFPAPTLHGLRFHHFRPCHRVMGAYSLTIGNAVEDQSCWMMRSSVFSGVSNLSAVHLNPRCFSQFIKCMCHCTYEQTTFSTYLPSPNINIGKGVLPPVLLKWLLLLPLDGLGIIIFINPVLTPRKEIYFRKHRQLHSKFLTTLTEQPQNMANSLNWYMRDGSNMNPTSHSTRRSHCPKQTLFRQPRPS